ncbi:MAG: type IV pilus modification PilV family protein [Desulfobulbaceae bacterium]
MNQQFKLMRAFSESGGFTLIEVIIALAVLTIGILSVNAMQIVSVRGNYTANRLTTAATWATDRAEILFNLDYDDPLLLDDGGGAPDGLAGLDDDDPTDPATTPDGSDVSPDGEYTIYWNVAEDEPLDNLKRIRVIILRNDLGTSKTLTLNHMKSKFM